MKKIQKKLKVKEIFEKFLQDKDIINKAKSLFNDIDKNEFPNITKYIEKEKIKIEDLFLGDSKKLRKIVNITNQYRSEFNPIYKKVKPYLKEKDDSKIPTNIKPYYSILKFFENSYNIFSDKRNKYAFEFAKELDISACPYCNLEYIETVTCKNQKIYRPDFDHFYPKNLYPLLSIALYNLIPSCNKCNEILKRHKDTKDFLTPYEYDFHNIAKFTVVFKNNKELPLDKIKNINQFELKLADKQTCAKNNDIQRAILEIEPRYNSRKDDVIDIICRYRTLTQRQLEESQRTFKRIYTEEQIIKIILGNKLEPKYINLKPLTKLKIDLKEMLLKNFKI